MTLGKRKGRSTPDTGNEDVRLVASEVQSEKKSLLSYLEKASTADHWRDWVTTLHGAGVKTLKALSELVKYAMSQKIGPEALLVPGEYGYLDREFQKVSNRRKLSPEICREALKWLKDEVGKKSQNEPNADDDDVNSGTVIEAASGMEAELTAASDDDARNSKSASSETNPRQGPDERQEGTPKRIDIIPDTPPHEKRHQRQDGIRSWNERANKVISQMNQNVMLTDDVLMTLGDVLMSYRESEARLVDTYQFLVDEKEIPSKLKRPPGRGENLYAPLYHPGKRPHWTLCVLMFDDKFIRLDFYDSHKDEARASRVKSFFTDWINARYHGSNLQFATKEVPQQNDGTSCGIFALEIMKRLLASDDVNQPIEPMEVRRALLQRMTSIDTTSPLLLQTYTLETLRSIQKHFPIRTYIDKISDAAGPQRASFVNLLRHAEEGSAQATEEINGLERELKDAQDTLLGLKTEAEVTKKGLANLSRFIAANETADFSGAMHSGMREDEQVADGSREPSAKRPRMSQSAMDFTQGLNNLMSQLEHNYKEETNKTLQESMGKTLDEVRKRVEEAERKEKELTEQLKRLRSHADSADAITSLCRGFSHFQNIDVDVRAIALDIIQRQAR
ncbi:hypothetical protein FOTG_18742 [Fusarium oxysporum f. sp. vasinfectum 25433]|uniref:Ubiquitin-like protease family profile domain-containing protein n=1 Tax=Fusarium oxysporum f. sp. vasinfectum 25433 TaxID=1089449 RepID=X0KVQ5_FUSOX|nr:hypothetical protein FOTG_18742 [Fusarium oxysporum f. sp. vasinfectum 25433]